MFSLEQHYEQQLLGYKIFITWDKVFVITIFWEIEILLFK